MWNPRQKNAKMTHSKYSAFGSAIGRPLQDSFLETFIGGLGEPSLAVKGLGWASMRPM